MSNLSVKVIGYTQPSLEFKGSHLEDIVGYCARVSNKKNQENFSTQQKLFDYCRVNRHWSIFQMCNIVLEISGPRDITRQFLRHDSMYATDEDVVFVPGFDKRFGGVQEFSQRYSDEITFTDREYRRQDSKNRQNSWDDLSPSEQEAYRIGTTVVKDAAKAHYDYMREGEVAKECARVVLPEGLTMSTLMVNGTVRSWMHYLDVRNDPGVTQHEHVQLARMVEEKIKPILPSILI